MSVVSEPRSAYFHMNIGQAPIFIRINKQYNIIDLAKRLLGALKLDEKTTYLYSYDNSIPVVPESDDILPPNYDIHYYLKYDEVSILNAHGRHASVKDKQGQKLAISVSANQTLDEIYKSLTESMKIKAPYHLVSFDPTSAEVAFTSITATEIMQYAGSGALYLEFTQTSYSNTTNRILDKFVWPFKVDTIQPSQYHSTLIKDHNTGSAVEAAHRFLAGIASDRSSSDPVRVKKAKLWSECVDRATSLLDDWSQTIPVLSTYKEVTRRLIINEVVLQVCKYEGRALLVEPLLCLDQNTLPSHFVGSGALDYLIGIGNGTCVNIYPSNAHVAAAEEDADASKLCADEDDQEEQADSRVIEVEVGDPLSRSVIRGNTSTDIEAKRLINHAAFRQLLAQICDKTYVDDDTILAIANQGEDSIDSSAPATKTNTPAQSQRKASGATTSSSSVGKATSSDNTLTGKKRLSSDSTVYAQRKNQKLTGVLTTGQTWQFFTFKFATPELMLDATAKLIVEYAGSLDMPVLQYSGEKIGSGLASMETVSRAKVELVMATLVSFGQE